MTSIFDLAMVRRHTVLRKGTAFALAPLAGAMRARASHAAYLARPPIVVNSLPKSGTHLLLQIARALPDAVYLGRFIASRPSLTLRLRSPLQMAGRLSALLPAEVCGAHIHHSAEAAQAMREIEALHFFVYRDPRDVLVSEAIYLAEMNRWHRMHRRFARLRTLDDRVALAIEGCDDRYPDCVSRMMPYADWLDDRSTIAMRFEDLRGDHLPELLERIAQSFEDRTGVSPDVAALTASIRPTASHTFREGGSGRWRGRLDDRTITRMTAALAPVLARYGYSD